MAEKIEVFYNQINTLDLMISHCTRKRELEGENITMRLSNGTMTWLT